jgi:hypothetical protein
MCRTGTGGTHKLTPLTKMKHTIIIASLLISLSSLHAQEYNEWYFGADFGVSVPTKILKTDYKVNGIRISDFQMAIKAGLRMIPLGNEESGLKYLIEFEARSDNWHNQSLAGTFLTVAGGTEMWFGEKGYFNVLIGASILYQETPRPYFSLRIGNGQCYFQPVIIPKVAKSGYLPTMIYLTLGFKSFSYAGVKYK